MPLSPAPSLRRPLRGRLPKSWKLKTGAQSTMASKKSKISSTSRKGEESEQQETEIVVDSLSTLAVEVVNVLHDYLAVIGVPQGYVLKNFKAVLPGLLAQLSLLVDIFVDEGHKRDIVDVLRDENRGIATSLFGKGGLTRGYPLLYPTPEKDKTELMNRGWTLNNDMTSINNMAPPEEIMPFSVMKRRLDGGYEHGRKEDRFREALIGHPGFDWLLRTMWVVQHVSVDNRTMDMHIRYDILEVMKDSATMSVGSDDLHGGSRIALDIKLECDFSKYRTEDIKKPVDMGAILVVAGNTFDSYATTAIDYARQLWPGIGAQMIQALEDKLEEFSDGSQFEVESNLGATVVRIRGSPATVLQVSETLVWLGAALKLPESNIACCRPFARRSESSAKHHMDVTCKWIEPLEDPLEETPSEASGTCWHEMFRRQSVAAGYPMPVGKVNADTSGLRADFAVLNFLAGTEWMHGLKRKLVFTGLNTILYPVDITAECVSWHFEIVADYLKSPLTALSDAFDCLQSPLTEPMLLSRTHCVGWTNNARVLAGYDSCAYDNIQPSSTPLAGKELAMEDMSVSVAYYAGLSTTLTLQGGAPVQMQTGNDTYEQIIERTQKYPVVMYDSIVKTGWLIDGASAVLHLLQIYLQHSPKTRAVRPKPQIALVNPDRQERQSDAQPNGEQQADEPQDVTRQVNGRQSNGHNVNEEQSDGIQAERLEDTAQENGHQVNGQEDGTQPDNGPQTLERDDLAQALATIAPFRTLATLLDESNRRIKLHHMGLQGDDQAPTQIWWCVVNQVTKFCKYIEQIHEATTDWRVHKASALKPPVLSTNLTGYDMFELGEDSKAAKELQPRHHQLNLNAERWIQFVRQSDVVVLMAKGLGRMVEPANCSCTQHLNVFPNESLLVAHAPTLSAIIKDKVPPPPEHVEPTEQSNVYVKLAKKVYWADAGNACSPCVCQGVRHNDTCRPTPIELKVAKPVGNQRCTFPTSLEKGAVVFSGELGSTLRNAGDTVKNAFKKVIPKKTSK